MEKQDREMLIRVDENVRTIKEQLPPYFAKVDRHEKLFIGLMIVGVVLISKLHGGWDLIKGLFEG